MKKIVALVTASTFIGCFGGIVAYELLSRPDGYLYMDPEDKGIYAKLKKDPDLYKKNSRLIFVFKKN